MDGSITRDLNDRDLLRHMRAQAERCRRLALAVDDKSIRSTLVRMADEYEDKAGALIG
jgi:hypothetical protein